MTRLRVTKPTVSPKRQRFERITRINAKVGRNINRSIILNTVRNQQPISRAEISEVTLLNKSTVSNIVAGLLEEELLVESPDRGGGIGRAPVNLTVRQGRHLVGAISFDAPSTRIAIVDIDGTIKAREEILTKAVQPEILVSQAVARLTAMQAALGPHKFHGVGVSVAGIVDPTHLRVIYASNLGWEGVNLGDIISEKLSGVEFVGMENDAKACALAELLLGKGQANNSNLVFLLIGPGLGAGIAVHGKILAGYTHAAGEVGHMTIVDGGEPCSCGNNGCWELYASERAPVQWFAEATRSVPGSSSSMTLSDVFGAAREGNADAINAIQRWAEHIGVGIGDMIRILDPEVVVVGGSITQIWDLAGQTVTNAAYGRGTFARQRSVTILPSSLADYPPLMGAAALPIRRIFGSYSLSL